MNWMVFGASLAAILILAGIAWALRLGRGTARIDEPEDAIREADAAIAGFSGESAIVGTDGNAALVVDGRGRVVALKVHGARIAVREIAWQKVRSVPAGMLIDTDERRFGSVLLAGVTALHIRQLAPQLTAE